MHTTSTEPDICRCLGLWIRRSIRLLELSESPPPELASLLKTLLAAERMLELADPQCLEPPVDEVELREWFRNRNLNTLERGELVAQLVESSRQDCLLTARRLGVGRRSVHRLVRMSRASREVKLEILLRAAPENQIRALVQQCGNGADHTSGTAAHYSESDNDGIPPIVGW